MRQPRFAPFVFAGILPLLVLPLFLPRPAAAQSGTPTLPRVSQVTIGQQPAGCDTCPPVACVGRPIRVRVAGMFPDECWWVGRVELIPSPVTMIAPPTLRIVLDDASCLGRVCLARPTPWKVDTLIPPLPQGAYELPVQIARASCGSPFPPESSWTAPFPFAVQTDCPPTELVPFVDEVVIGKAPCVTCEPVVCADEPFPVRLSGVLPDDCVEFRGLSLVPVTNIRPGPPIVRATFAVNDCLGVPCTLQPRRWSATALLPALPAGGNGLTVQSMQVSMCDSTKVLALDSGGVPFTVQDTCARLVPSCFVYDWSPPASSGCNAPLVNDTASVAMRIASPVALAGLQGVLRAQPGLEVRSLEPVGPAAGMTLQWTKRPGGAAFVMFATQGAPISPAGTGTDSTHVSFLPVLRVGVRFVADAATPATTPLGLYTLRADSLFGSDETGEAVRTCLLRCVDSTDVRCAPPVARFCVQASCDVNHDGRADVSDLVRMVHCVVPGGSCPDTSARYDCNGDGSFSLDDVICCAWRILRGNQPPAGGGRIDPSVAFSFGDPQETGQEVELPITLLGADHVGAARVSLRFPSDRYDVEDFGLVGSPAGWLVLHEVSGNRVLVGLVATDPAAAGPSLPLRLRLHLRTGADHGGEVVAQDAEVSGIDGAALRTAIPGSGAVMDPSASVSFTQVGPNPATGEARFSLSLPRASDVDVAVHDLAGRRVATLQHGPLAAGVHPFTWDGRTDRGGTARDGVYFVRVRAGGVERARKTVFVRGH